MTGRVAKLAVAVGILQLHKIIKVNIGDGLELRLDSPKVIAYCVETERDDRRQYRKKADLGSDRYCSGLRELYSRQRSSLFSGSRG